MLSKLGLGERIELLGRHFRGEKASKLCREYQISRVLFYRLLNRYNKSGYLVGSILPQKAKKSRQIRQASEEVEERVKELVISDPAFSSHKISLILTNFEEGKYKLGNHGVQNILRRLDLNTIDKRAAWVTDQSIYKVHQ